MAKRHFLMIAVLICAALLLAGCGKNKGENGEAVSAPLEQSAEGGAGFRNTVIYLSDGNYIVPMMKRIPWEEGIGRATLGYLVENGPGAQSISEMGLIQTVPEGVTFSLRIGDDGIATVDLKGYKGSPSAAEEKNMLVSIVNTLAEFPSIDAVTLRFDGDWVEKLPHGTEVREAMTPFKLNVEDGEAESSASGDSGANILFFPNSSASLNIPVTRYSSDGTGFAAAVKELISGSGSGELISFFPEGARLLSAEIIDGQARVDMSAEFRNIENTDGLAEAAYECLFLTADAKEDIYSLTICIEGKPWAASADFLPPEYANTFRE